MPETNAPPATQNPPVQPQTGEPIQPPGTFSRNRADPWTTGQRRAGLVALALIALLGLWTLRVFLPAIGWAVILAISL